MSRTRVMVASLPQWQDDGPAYARRAGFGGSALGHFSGTTFTRPPRAAAGTATVEAAKSHRRTK